jgi:hypothetical protein
VRGWVKGSIAVLVAALVCAAIAPGAIAAEAPERGEDLYLEVAPSPNVRAWLEVRPSAGVAVIKTLVGVTSENSLRRRYGMVDYAARIPKGPIEASLDVTIPAIASIVGKLSPVGRRRIEFQGELKFKGNGGYLSFKADRSFGEVLKGEGEQCIECQSGHPGLFQYITEPLEPSFLNSQVLLSTTRTGSRMTSFLAAHYRRGYGSGTEFEAETFERLPTRVAVTRTIAISEAAAAGLKVASTSEHPESATVKPPAPFSGSAVYRSAGSIRSPASGELAGSLSVDLFGVKVTVAGARSRASLINLTPGL